MKRVVTCYLFLALLAAFPALGASSVSQSGNVTPKHSVMWTTNGVVQDGGSATNGFLSELGITKMGGCALGINSAVTTGGYNQLCLGVSNSQGYLSLQNFGSQSPTPFNFIFNGIIYPFPGPGNGDVSGPSPAPTIGHVALWNGSLTLKDGGSPVVLSAASYGAVGDCTTDDATALRAAANAAVALASQFASAPTTGGNKVAVDLGGACLALGSNVQFATANGLVLQNGKIVPAGGFSGTLITFKGGYNTVQGIYCDGRKTADCFDASSGTFAFHALNNQWAHNPNFGLKVSMGGGVIEGNLGSQWFSSDTEFTDLTQYTSRVLWILDSDGIVTNNIMHNGLYPLACGDDASRICGSILLTSNHFYNGTVPSNPGSGLANAVAIHVGVGGAALKFVNTYIDNGYVDLFSPGVTFDGAIFNLNGINTIDHWIKLTASSASQGLGSFILSGPLTFGGSGTGTTTMFLMAATGGNSWATNTAFLNALLPAQITMSNGARTNYVSGSDNFAAHFQGGTNPIVCIGLAGGFTTPVETSICQASSNNLQFNVNGFTTLIDSTGSFQYVAPAAPLTCASGCGTSPTVTGANGFGSVLLGTTPSNTVVINFSPTWLSIPRCNVWERQAASDVTSWSLTTTQLTVVLGTGTAGRSIAWQCATNG